MRSGLIGLEESIRQRQALRELLLASAHAAVATKAFYPRMAYAQALKVLDAHKNAALVKLAGILGKEGHSFRLRSATLLDVIPAPQ